MKIKDGYVLKAVAGNNVVVNVGGSMDFNGMITLNETGALLWKTLAGGTDMAGLTEVLLAEYDIDNETAERDAALFIKKLEDAGVLE